MTKRITLLLLLLFIIGMNSNSLVAQDDDTSPFRTIVDFDTPEDVNFFRDPGGAGQTTGVIFQNEDLEYITYRRHNTEIVNSETGSTGSLELGIVWNTSDTLEWFEPTDGGYASHFVRLYANESNAIIEERRFFPGEGIEVYLYGDGKSNRFRFMVRDGLRKLEGSKWITVDWVGWQRLTWDYNDAANVFGWAGSGDGQMDLNPDGSGYFYFDSFLITRDEEGTTEDVLFYFDDLRIVEPINVDFNITDADGTESISIAGINYPEGQTNFQFLPGDYEFFVQKNGFLTYNGTFLVDDQDLTIDVALDAGVDPEYDVVFTVMGTDGELLTDYTISINGESAPINENTFGLTPGFYTYTVEKELYFNVSGSFKVLDTGLFINVELIEIPDLYDNIYLKWDVAPTANNNQEKDEKYSVWVAEVNNDEQAFSADDYVLVFEETLSQSEPSWVYKQRMVELSAFERKNIRVAFRHFGSSGNDRVLIDNIRIEALDRVEEITDYYLNENFDGGIPEGFDPNIFDPADPDAYNINWLPENWSKVDNDGDGFNWYFYLDVDQSLNVFTQMHSRSTDTAEGALTPDNWLVSPYLEMPMVVFYDVTFDVKDGDGNAINNAVVTFNGVEAAAGDYVFNTTSGDYAYQVTLDGYVPVSGNVTVGREGVTVEVILVPPSLYNVTFTIDMRQADGFEPGVTNVYFTGTFPGWDFAVPGTYPEQQLNPTNNVYFFNRTLQLEAGTYNYKYFDGTSLDDAEWPGQPFRQIVVEGDMQVTDVFGVQVSVDELNPVQARLFPNPANQSVQIIAERTINSISIFTIAGQQVYTSRVQGTNHTINLSGFGDGFYLVQIVTNQGVATQKLQVVR